MSTPAATPGRSLTVAIPALNEEKNIRATIDAVLRAASRAPDIRVEIIVVDDGSSDATAALVAEAARHNSNVRLLQNPANMGLGASIRRAISEASTEKFIFIPGDNDIPLSTLELLFVNAYAADVVMIYFVNNEIRGRQRYLLSGLFRMAYMTFFDLYLIYLNGPAVYPLAKLRELHLHSTRFSIVAEINVKLLRQGVTYMELPANRQVGLEGSTSATLRSLMETMRVFFHLLIEVYVREPARYAQRPKRVIPNKGEALHA